MALTAERARELLVYDRESGIALDEACAAYHKAAVTHFGEFTRA